MSSARRPEELVPWHALWSAGATAQRVAGEYFDAIVNCTPVGAMVVHRLTSAELNCRSSWTWSRSPGATELLHRAWRKGIETISGAEMFLAQGFAAVRIWTGERAPESPCAVRLPATLVREEKSQGNGSDK